MRNAGHQRIQANPDLRVRGCPDGRGRADPDAPGRACDDNELMRTALVVDDHAGFRSQARRLLERAGYRVVGEAAGGESALAIASSVRPDVVLLDVQLPDMSGFDVAIRLVGEAASVSDVVLVSSREAAAYGAQIERCGARGFIWKGDLTVATLRALVGEP